MKKIIIIAVFLMVIAAVAGFFLIGGMFGVMTVPSNSNIMILPGADLPTILPQGFGGREYEEKLFDNSQDISIWMPLCYEPMGVDDAEDVCRGFVKGYLREYKSYSSVIGIKSTDVKLKFYINEYENAAAAKEAALFLTIDAAMPVIKIDGAGVIGWDLGDSHDSRYTLVAGKYLITALGHPAAKELIGEVIKSYKK